MWLDIPVNIEQAILRSLCHKNATLFEDIFQNKRPLIALINSSIMQKFSYATT
jgi:hypothetical protein